MGLVADMRRELRHWESTTTNHRCSHDRLVKVRSQQANGGQIFIDPVKACIFIDLVKAFIFIFEYVFTHLPFYIDVILIFILTAGEVYVIT